MLQFIPHSSASKFQTIKKDRAINEALPLVFEFSISLFIYLYYYYMAMIICCFAFRSSCYCFLGFVDHTD